MMEGIEGMMEKLQLSVTKKIVRIDLDPGEKIGDLPTQAVGKLLSDRDGRGRNTLSKSCGVDLVLGEGG
jgi:hypothetical protein